MKPYIFPEERKVAKPLLKSLNISAKILYHGVRFNDPLMKLKILGILTNGICCMDRLKTILDAETIKMIEKNRDGAYFNGDDFISCFSWDEDTNYNIRYVYMFTQNILNGIAFMLDKEALNLSGGSGELFARDNIPVKYIQGITIPTTHDVGIDTDKVLQDIFMDSDLYVPVYSLETGKYLFNTSKYRMVEDIKLK